MRFTRLHALVAAIAAVVLATAAAAGEQSAVRVRTLLDHLTYPSNVAFLGNGAFIIAERPGRLLLATAKEDSVVQVRGLPPLVNLADVALDPSFETTRLLILSYTANTEGGIATHVLRARLINGVLEDSTVIFQTRPGVPAVGQHGGRVLFLPDRTLLVTLGDGQGNPSRAQDQSTHLGKIVRLDLEGRAPRDNPFARSATAAPEIFALGFRNVQGIARDARTGVIWVSDHGPRFGDELNRLRPGANFGWPLRTEGRAYDGSKIVTVEPSAAFDEPVYSWQEAVAPGALAVCPCDRYPEWKNSLLVAALAGRALRQLQTSANKVVRERVLLRELGERIRAVSVGPDGLIYLLTDSLEGKLLRLDPLERARPSLPTPDSTE